MWLLIMTNKNENTRHRGLKPNFEISKKTYDVEVGRLA